MKFIIDDKIPYIKGALEPFGEVVYLPGSKTTPSVLANADALVTRTRTVCNEALLAGSSVRFIATATIGFDHIDTIFCDQNGIKWTNAPGCNSKSVEQYIASALFTLAAQKGFSLKGKTIGVVGVGQVGSKVANVCRLFGMKVLLNDPPRARTEGLSGFCSLDQVKNEADIITFHVPLNMDGPDATYHIVGKDFFRPLKKQPLLINSCRGEVFDTRSVKQAVKEKLIGGLVIDCWENEPAIDLELLHMVDLATPHIAGYSKDGKANGTTMCIQAISRFFNLGIDNWQAEEIEMPEETTLFIDGKGLSDEKILASVILSTYDISKDDALLKRQPELFEKWRGDYPVRREYPVYTVKCKNVSFNVIEKLKTLGFNVLLMGILWDLICLLAQVKLLNIV